MAIYSCRIFDQQKLNEFIMLKNFYFQTMKSTGQNPLQLNSNAEEARISALTHPFNIICLTLCAIGLSACATTDTTKKTVTVEKTITTEKTVTTEKHSPNINQASKTSSTIDTQIISTVTSPLSDLNLIRAEISPALTAAVNGPYLPVSDKSCESISAEVMALDYALGPDLDAPAGVDPDLMEKGAAELGNAAVGALRRTVEGAIPFRSWIRKFSGAEKHSREVATAVAAGIVRRAFLKGLGMAYACPAPAAPRQIPVL